MNAFKRIFAVMLVGGALIGMTACGNEDDTQNEDTLGFDDATVDTEASMDVIFEEVDNSVEAGINFDDVEGGKFFRDPIIDCAVITHDRENKTMTIDFGDGCEGPGGRVRSGKIITSYSDRRYLTGATRTVTFEEFFIDSVQVEGTRTITNITTASNAAPTFRIVLSGGRLTWNDGTFATRESEHTRTWTRAENPAQDEATVEGSAEGQSREGVAYSSQITEPMVFQRQCLAQEYFFPVSGTLETTLGDNVFSIDYGDGDCDNLATVTINGETKEIELDAKARKSAAGKRPNG